MCVKAPIRAFSPVLGVVVQSIAKMLLKRIFNKKLTDMNTKNILIDTCRLNFIVESRQDSSGNTSYYVTTSVGRVHFHSMDSVLDFINSNSFGYVQK